MVGIQQSRRITGKFSKNRRALNQWTGTQQIGRYSTLMVNINQYMGKPTTFLREALPEGTIQPVSGTVGHLTSRKQCRVVSTSGKREGGLSKCGLLGIFSLT